MKNFLHFLILNDNFIENVKNLNQKYNNKKLPPFCCFLNYNNIVYQIDFILLVIFPEFQVLEIPANEYFENKDKFNFDLKLKLIVDVSILL